MAGTYGFLVPGPTPELASPGAAAVCSPAGAHVAASDCASGVGGMIVLLVPVASTDNKVLRFDWLPQSSSELTANLPGAACQTMRTRGVGTT